MTVLFVKFPHVLENHIKLIPIGFEAHTNISYPSLFLIKSTYSEHYFRFVTINYDSQSDTLKDTLLQLFLIKYAKMSDTKIIYD